mgnify:CR=1 FL=1
MQGATFDGDAVHQAALAVEDTSYYSAMVQADTLGIPIANVLRVQAVEMRTKRSQRAEEMAQKVPVKILGPLLLCFLPGLFIIILGPALITVADVFLRG